MANDADTRAALAQAALRYVPPSIRKSLVEDIEFRESYGLKIDGHIPVVGSKATIKRSELFAGIRAILSGGPEHYIIDSLGSKWTLKKKKNNEGNLPRLELSLGDQSRLLPEQCVLFAGRKSRLRFLSMVASDMNLPSVFVEKWRKLLDARKATDDEFELFAKELESAPIYVVSILQDEIVANNVRRSTLVPLSSHYYDRLIGPYDGSQTIQEFAVGAGKATISQLFEWRLYDGFLNSLFLSSHHSLTSEMPAEQLASADLLRAYEILCLNGDRISKVGAVEIGIRLLPLRPEIKDYVVRLVEQVRDDDASIHNSEFRLLSALFVLVDGELSRLRLFVNEPPFYRRLAALSQTALIQRQLIGTKINNGHFADWSFDQNKGQFYLQSHVDLRIEPRWSPEQADGHAMQFDSFGRIMNAANKYEANIRGNELADLIMGDGSSSIKSICEFPEPYFPGPLEGTRNASFKLSETISEAIHDQLSEQQLKPSSFNSLINSALLFSVTEDQADFAAKVLKQAKYQLSEIGDRKYLVGVLVGLASVAAISSSHVLANELRVLVRIYRRDSQYHLTVEEVVQIYLKAAASFEDLNDWKSFVGECFTELAFSSLSWQESFWLQTQVRCLCHVVPSLWVACGRADAALTALNANYREILAI